MEEFIKIAGELERVTLLELNYRKTMMLLRALKAGAVALDSVSVEGDDWKLITANAAEAEPNKG